MARKYVIKRAAEELSDKNFYKACEDLFGKNIFTWGIKYQKARKRMKEEEAE